MPMQRRTFLIGASSWPLATAAFAQTTSGVTDTEILLGTHQDLSGPLAALGTYLRDGMQLAVDDVNNAGGIHGRKLRLLVEDNGYDPKKAVLATQKLVERDKVFALVATLGAATTQASMGIALDQGIPMLFPGAPAEFTYTPFNRIKFGMAVPYGDQVRAGLKYAVEKLGKKRIGILYQDDETGHQILRGAEEQLKAQGMVLAERTSYKRGEVDFSSQVAKLKAASIDLLLLGTLVRETAGSMIEARKQGWKVDMLAFQPAMNSSTVKIGGEAVEGLYATTQFLPLLTQEQTPALQALMQRYRTKYGKDPEDGITFGYLAMQLFAEGARNAGRQLTVDSLVKGIERISNWRTVLAAVPVSYSATERLGSRASYLTQVKDGKFVAITGPVGY